MLYIFIVDKHRLKEDLTDHELFSFVSPMRIEYNEKLRAVDEIAGIDGLHFLRLESSVLI
jgi:hypothetical protein